MKGKFLVILCVLIGLSNTLNKDYQKDIVGYIKNGESEYEVWGFIDKGDMMGYFTYDNFWEIYDIVSMAFPEFVSEKIKIGETSQKNSIDAFKIGKNMDFVRKHKRTKNQKSVAVFNAQHHAREPMCLSTLLAVFLKELYNLYQKKAETLYNQIDIVFIPIVNPDTYQVINKAYSEKDPNDLNNLNWSKFWELINYSRKNRTNCNDMDKCETGQCGVDINRNYGYKYGIDDKGSSDYLCDDSYRGTHAFSEPETQAMKNFFDGNRFVVSVVNLHAFGPIVMNPMNWDDSNMDLMENFPRHHSFYKEFEQASTSTLKTLKFGNVAQTLDYTSNGESLDWELQAHGQFAFTYEVGNDDPASQYFYPPTNIIADVVKDFYPSIQDFIDYHKTNLVNVSMTVVKRTSKQQLQNIIVFNKGLSTLYNPVIKIKLWGARGLYTNLNDIKYQAYDNLQDAEASSNDSLNMAKMILTKDSDKPLKDRLMSGRKKATVLGRIKTNLVGRNYLSFHVVIGNGLIGNDKEYYEIEIVQNKKVLSKVSAKFMKKVRFVLFNN